jgi:hypothetical protein
MRRRRWERDALTTRRDERFRVPASEFSTLRSTAHSTPPTKPRTGRYRTAAVIGAASAGLVLTGAPIATAAPASVTKPVTVWYGASSFSGTVNFSDRTVTIQGRLHAVGCRYVGGVPYTDATVTVPVLANQPGGADNADVILQASDGQARKNVHK